MQAVDTGRPVPSTGGLLMMNALLLIGRGLILLGSAGGALAAEWPEWRGPDGQGHCPGSGWPVRWSQNENIAWKTDLPGRGWSSPVIEGPIVWMTTALETVASEEQRARRLKDNKGDQPLTLLAKVELLAIGVDRESGRLVKQIPLLTVREPQWVHELNSYASPTPVVGNGRLFCHFGALGTAAVDTQTGAVLWTNTDLTVMHENGPGSSPVLWNDLVIFHLDGSDRQFIAALDAKTGRVAWQTDRSGTMHENPQLKKSYGTPLIMAVNGREQLVSPASNWLYAYDKTGHELWKVSYGILGFSLTPRPVTGHGLIFMSTGFMKPELLAIRHDGVATPEIAWRSTKSVPTLPSPVLVGDELYFVSEGGILTCLDAQTGTEHFRERLGGEFSSSPTAADGRLYLTDRQGVTTVVKAGKTLEIVAKNPLPGRTFASLAAADHSFFLRTDSSLYRIQDGGNHKPAP